MWRSRGGSLACAPERSKGSGFTHTPLIFWQQRTSNRSGIIIYPEAPQHRPQHNLGPPRSERVQGAGEAPRHPTLLGLGREGYGGASAAGVPRGRGEALPASGPAGATTIAMEERPCEAMSLPDAEADQTWARAHIND